MSLFDALAPQKLDPIMAGFQEFTADPRPGKVNLGVGMYYDEAGRVPILRVVQEAERRTAGQIPNWGYLLPDGMPTLRERAKRLVFGDALVDAEGDRIATVQSLGGTGALKLAADVIRRLAPDATVAMSRPTWGNHPSIFAGAGLKVAEYPYFDAATGDADWPAMRDAVAAMAPGTVLLLHACCHNPTGADLSPEAWEELAGIVAARRLVPVVDMAYAGFGEGLEADSAATRVLARSGVPMFVATSFSKSFGLYGERVGVLSVVAADARQAGLVLDAVKIAIRTNYSTPPVHGALLVSTILGDAALRADWEAELDGMRRRILRMRHGLAERLAGSNRGDFSRLVRQRGLFSYTGLSAEQMARLKEEFAIYGVSDGRFCMAALTETMLDRVAEGIRTVTV